MRNICRQRLKTCTPDFNIFIVQDVYAATVMTAKSTVKLPSSSGSIPQHVAVQLKCCQWWTSQSAMIVEDHQTLNLLVSLYDPSLCMKEACHSIFSLKIVLHSISCTLCLSLCHTSRCFQLILYNCQLITFTLDNQCVFTLQTSGTEPKIKYYIEVTTEPGTK